MIVIHVHARDSVNPGADETCQVFPRFNLYAHPERILTAVERSS